jgi:GR25 family glycosyltransferase involved in LPS biosynthesis
MKIGITFLPLGSAFSGGSAQTAVHLGELFILLGHKVTLISMAQGRVWFDDCKALPQIAGFQLVDACSGGCEQQDLLIDTLGYLTEEARRRLGRRCVVFSRGPAVLSDQESSIYGLNNFITNYKGASAVWTWAHWDEGEIQYLETMSKLPVVRLPFIWFPTLLEIYKREVNINTIDGPTECHIMETNTKTTSSLHVPLIIAKEAADGFSRMYVHSSKHIVDYKYFSENIKKNLSSELVSKLEWIDRQRILDVASNRNAFIISHLRFRELRNLLLDCVWLGIPIVHNSHWLRDFGHGYEKLFYEGNSINEAVAAVGQVGCWTSLKEAQDSLLKRVSAIDVSLYVDALAATAAAAPAEKFVIQFTDFWAGFQADYNFFTHLLQEELSSSGDKRCVIGVGEEFSGHPDLLIFGPYSEKWRDAPADIPKVHYTGEWSGPRDGPGVILNLGFENTEDDSYIRLPLWVISINWFGADNRRLVNPTLMDLRDLIRTNTDWETRKKFCAFVVSNPSCEPRNLAFKELSNWRHVDSGGALYNNIGYGLAAGPGGGGGERAKVDFYRDYKYVICYENQKALGYTTEKLLHAKAAGCVPIYWGDGSDFDERGFINMTSRGESVVDVIREFEESGCGGQMAAVPALSYEKEQWCRALIKRVGQTILARVNIRKQWSAGIDKCYMINLKRRADRLERFYASHSGTEGIEVIEAFDGRKLKLGPNLVRLFHQNSFGWKRSAMGCSLSHLSVWKKIAEDGGAALILEDDVRMLDTSSWRSMLHSAMGSAPSDYDVLYIGGILPPNEEAWYKCKEAVNAWWCRIGLNQHFRQVGASRFFHFCAYSYILSSTGAKKLLSIIEKEDGYRNISDQQILHSWTDLNIYVSDPIIAGCYQDTDPTYRSSNFNDIGRKDKFDSDIWTSHDSFQIDGSTQIAMRLDVNAALQEARTAMVEHKPKLICFSEELRNVFEEKWLSDMFGFSFKNIDVCDGTEAFDKVIIVYQGRCAKQQAGLANFLESIRRKGYTCGVIHLSDEFGVDNISFYSEDCIRWVVRNYWREGLVGKVMVLPLGFYRTSGTSKKPELMDRALAWSFHGTNWYRRADMMRILCEVHPHKLFVRGRWEEPMTDEVAMLSDMENSWIIPCPEGNNTESFRIYEALEAGAFPVLCDEGRGNWSTHFYLWLQMSLPSICILRNWEEAIGIFHKVKSEPEVFETRRGLLMSEWGVWKEKLRGNIMKLVEMLA